MLRFLKTNRTALGVYITCTFYALAFNSTTGWTLFFGMSILGIIALLFALQYAKLECLDHEIQGHYQETLTLETRILKSQIGTFQGELSLKKRKGRLASFDRNALNTIRYTFDNPFERGHHENVNLKIYASDSLYVLKVPRIHQDVRLKIYPTFYQNIFQDINSVIYEYETVNTYQNGDTNFELKDLVEYQEGMSMKSIHWKRSSQQNMLISKILDRESKEKLSIAFYNGKHPNYERALGIFYTLITASKSYAFSKAFLNGENVLVDDTHEVFLSVCPSETPKVDFKLTDVIVTPIFLENLGKRHLQLYIGKLHIMCYRGNQLLAKIPLNKGDASYD